MKERNLEILKEVKQNLGKIQELEHELKVRKATKIAIENKDAQREIAAAKEYNALNAIKIPGTMSNYELEYKNFSITIGFEKTIKKNSS